MALYYGGSLWLYGVAATNGGLLQMTTLKDLCRVRRLPAGSHIVPGTITARDGAWQHKHVVLYVIYHGKPLELQYKWTVGLQYLGRCYSDGRIIPCTTSHIHEVTIYRSSEFEYRGLSGYIPVEPSGLPLRKLSPDLAEQFKHRTVADAPIDTAAIYDKLPKPKKALIQTKHSEPKTSYYVPDSCVIPKTTLTITDFLI